MKNECNHDWVQCEPREESLILSLLGLKRYEDLESISVFKSVYFCKSCQEYRVLREVSSN